MVRARWRFGWWPLGLLLLLTLPRGAAPDTGVTRLKVVMVPYLSNAPLFIAATEGYFTEQGLEVEFVQMTRTVAAVPALLGGELDVLPAVISPGLFNAVARGGVLRLVANKGHIAPTGCSATTVLVRRALADSRVLEDPAQLRGRRIVMPNPASFEGFVVEKLLRQGGVRLDEIQVVDIPPPAEPEAFRNGAIDITVAGEPWLTRAVQTGHAVPWIPAQQLVPGFDYAFIVFGPTLLEKQPEAGRRFMTAYLRAVRQYAQGKTERNLEILARYTGLERELLRGVCWPAIRQDGRVDMAGVLDFQTWAADRRFLDRSVGPERFWDGSFVEHAIRALAPAPR